MLVVVMPTNIYIGVMGNAYNHNHGKALELFVRARASICLDISLQYGGAWLAVCRDRNGPPLQGCLRNKGLRVSVPYLEGEGDLFHDEGRRGTASAFLDEHAWFCCAGSNYNLGMRAEDTGTTSVHQMRELQKAVGRAQEMPQQLRHLPEQVLGLLQEGDVVRSSRAVPGAAAEGRVWVELAAEEVWARGWKPRGTPADGDAALAGFVLTESDSDCYLRYVPEDEWDEHPWPYAESMERAEEMGVPFELDPRGCGLRPRPLRALPPRLSCWSEPGLPAASWRASEPLLHPPPAAVAADARRRREADCMSDVRSLLKLARLGSSATGAGPVAQGLPRLLVSALLLAGTTLSSLRSFLRYHFHVGFEGIVLFLEHSWTPPQEAHAINGVARACARAAGLEASAVRVVSLDERWWEEAAGSRAASPRRWEAARGARRHGDAGPLQELLAADALRHAGSLGFDWLVHAGTCEEALLVPSSRDVRGFFSSLPDGVDHVHFHALEAVPGCQSGDCFMDTGLFRVPHQFFTEDGRSGGPVSLGAYAGQEAVVEADDCPELREMQAQILAAREAFIRRSCQGEQDPGVGVRPAGWPPGGGLGRSACRASRGGAPLPLPGRGAHCFVAAEDGPPLTTLVCSGAASPVMLHFGACNLEAWRRGVPAAAVPATSPRAGAAEAQRDADAGARSLHRALATGSAVGELPFLAAHGALARVSTVQEVLQFLDLRAAAAHPPPAQQAAPGRPARLPAG
ncbi:unnamed protein product, partial [Prorocentrum cordatum]